MIQDMKMKSLYLLLLSIIMLLASCSNNTEEDIIGGDDTGDHNAYFFLSLTFPSVSSNTKAGEAGDGYQQGLSSEQKFQQVAVILVNAENKVVNNLYYYADDFTPDGNSATDDDTVNPDPSTEVRSYLTKTPRLVVKGAVKVYVFLNPTTELNRLIALGQTLDPTMMTEITRLTSPDITDSYAKADNFLMGNSSTPVLTTIDGTRANPTVVKVNVERFASKLVENTTATSFDVQNTMTASSVTASFTSFAYTNLNKRAFFLKQVQQRTDDGAVAGEYVVDPNFVSGDYLSFSPASPFYGNDFFIIGNKEVNTPFATAAQIYYSLENTMISNEQYTNKTTTIVYKAAISINGASNSTFYTYKNIIYRSYSDLATAYNDANPATPNALQSIFTEQDVANAYSSGDVQYSTAVKELNTTLENNNIKCYYNGECYYTWPIKHWDQNELLGRMKYGVVRNNVYYMRVRSIESIGTPWVPGGPEDPDNPEHPDDELYIKMVIEVKPWNFIAHPEIIM